MYKKIVYRIIIFIGFFCMAPLSWSVGSAPSVTCNSPGTAASSIPSVTTTGKYFMLEGTGKRFQLRSVALSDSPVGLSVQGDDMLADSQCNNFVSYVLPLLKTLNVNAVRVYNVDSVNNTHSKVMNILAANNIYVQVSVVDSQNSINQINPIYSTSLWSKVTGVVNEFSDFNNTFAYDVGNEVLVPGTIQSDLCAAYPSISGFDCNQLSKQVMARDILLQKSLIRDIHKYQASNALRMIPVGLAMQDSPTWSSVSGYSTVQGAWATAVQFESGLDVADYVGMNWYRVLGGNPQDKGQAQITLASAVDQYCIQEYNIPVFQSEAGGFTTGYPYSYDRKWSWIANTYQAGSSKQKRKVVYNLSGVTAYSMFDLTNHMGLYGAFSYESPSNPQPTTYGGATSLGNVYNLVSKNPGRIPPSIQQSCTQSPDISELQGYSLPQLISPVFTNTSTANVYVVSTWNQSPTLPVAYQGLVKAPMYAGQSQGKLAGSQVSAVPIDSSLGIIVLEQSTNNFLCYLPASSISKTTSAITVQWNNDLCGVTN